MKKSILLFLFSLFGIIYGQSYNSFRDYISEFYTDQEKECILSYNFHYGLLDSYEQGFTNHETKEVILNFLQDDADYSSRAFMKSLIHETIHIIIHYRGQETDSDGHGVYFMNEAYRFSKLLKGSRLELSTREIVGKIYDAKMVQLHSKGLYTDEDLAKREYENGYSVNTVMGQPVDKSIDITELEKDHNLFNSIKIADKTKDFSVSYFLINGIMLDFSYGIKYVVFDIYGSYLFSPYSLESFGVQTGFQFPMKINNISLVPSVALDLSFFYYTDRYGVSADIGVIFKLKAFLEIFELECGIPIYANKPFSFFVGVGIGSCN